MATINSYLSLNGDCEDAFYFFKSLFKGGFVFIGRYIDMSSQEAIADSGKKKIYAYIIPLFGQLVD